MTDDLERRLREIADGNYAVYRDSAALAQAVLFYRDAMKADNYARRSMEDIDAELLKELQ